MNQAIEQFVRSLIWKEICGIREHRNSEWFN